MNRLSNISSHLSHNTISRKNQDDVVICSAVRTAITKAKKGGFKDTSPEIMLSSVLKAAAERANLDPKLIQDIAVGNNLQPGAG